MAFLIYEDFTETNYKKLIKLAKKRLEFVSFSQHNKDIPHVLWRHDVDFSIHRALKLAQIEFEEGVISTYFIFLHSEFYNPFEREISKIIHEIIRLNHRIGIHFDQSFFCINNQKNLESMINFEKNILEGMFDIKIDAISFHNPDFDGKVCIKNENYCGLINSYCPKIFDNYKYVSDSNGYWRFDRLEDVLKNQNYIKLHVLTHPAWWVPENLSPRQRVQRCIDGRAEACAKNYDEFFRNNEGRLNVK